MQDWIEYLQTLTARWSDNESVNNDEWSDQYYGLSEYKEYADLWC